MKRKVSLFLLFPLSLIAIGYCSCSNDKPNDTNIIVSTHDTITVGESSDSIKILFKKLVAAMPVPFDMLKKFSDAHLPFKGEILNNPANATSYNSNGIQSLNLGIYGADLAYLISQNKLSESAPYLKSIRRLSDAVVVPSAFDVNMLKRFDSNQNQKDSMQNLMRASYSIIDSSLQGNDRFPLASLVLTGGWLEGIYITTKHIGGEQQNEKNKVLFDLLSTQQPYIENLTSLLGYFPNDSICKGLHEDFLILKKTFPNGSNIPPAEFSTELISLSNKVAEMRNRIIQVK